MKVRGPLVTLAAVAALGVGISIVNISQESEPRANRQAGRGLIAGGLVFFGLVYVWLTSALWFFQTSGITF